MRLLDRVAQSSWPLLVKEGGVLWRLPSACDYSADITRSPLRYVLTDDLVRLCVELAYAEGDTLASCLDLVQLPPGKIWIEWNDPVKRAEMVRIAPNCGAWANAPVLRKGVLISQESGTGAASKSFTVRTLCTQESDPTDALVMATEAVVDLKQRIVGCPPSSFLDGGTLVVQDSTDPGLNAVLQHIGFRLDPTWQRYYRRAAPEHMRTTVMRDCLGSVALTIPMVLSLLLLLSLRTGFLQLPLERLKSAKGGKTTLLEHFEIACPVPTLTEPANDDLPEAARGTPRLHSVRGHLVRRGDSVYWRRPHWRGHVRLNGGQASELRPIRRA